MPTRWNVTELSPNESPKDLANKLADHFNQVTNISKPLDLCTEVPKSSAGPEMIPQLLVNNVEKVSRNYKKVIAG